VTLHRLLESHLVTLVLFSSLTSAVFATLLREDTRSRLRFGLFAFMAFVVSAIVVGWLMYPWPS
jgi:hypothetical protein